MANDRISRHSLLARGAVLAGAAVAGAVPGVARAGTRRVAYRLDASAEGGCKACRRHAQNKLFASAADVTRAHPGCRCKVVRTTVSGERWLALFGHPTHPARRDVDRRRPWVRALLRHTSA